MLRISPCRAGDIGPCYMGVMKGCIAAAVLAIAMATPAHAARSNADAVLADMLKGRVAQPPVRCIAVSPTDASAVIVRGKAIVWRSGARLYVNVPRARADMLDDDDVLVTEPFGSQICRNDRVTPIGRLSRIPKAPLILGMFTPYARATK